MKSLIDATQLRKALLKDENQIAKMFFKTENYPIGFLTGIFHSATIANHIYALHYDIDIAIEELFNRLDTINDNCEKCGYYFVMSYLHYINDDLILALLASQCIQSCYKRGVIKND